MIRLRRPSEQEINARLLSLDQPLSYPEAGATYSDFCAQSGVNPKALPLAAKWRNAKCDALVAWSHIHHRGDLLVTSDGNFHKATKRNALLALGARDIKKPHEAVALIENAA